MAHFAKHGSQSTKGWDATRRIQTLGMGSSAEIGLWGADQDGVDLDVAAVDSICTVHEKPRSRGSEWRTFVITALRAGQTEIRATPIGSLSAWATMQVDVTESKAGIRLVFFPGERTAGGRILGAIYVIGGNGERFRAAGGPPKKVKDRGGHTAEPTRAGIYILGPKQHVTTFSWPNSTIPWGAQLRVTSRGEVEFKGDTGGWALATGPTGVVTQAWLAFNSRGKEKVPLAQVQAQIHEEFFVPGTDRLRSTTWQLNDFGVWGWNLRQNGKPTGFYIHTTVDDESDTARGLFIRLANSHGCIHVVPAERDRMIAAGYLKEGIELQVRSYNETGPP